MNDLELLISQIQNFKTLNQTEKTKIFAWFVQSHLKKVKFMPVDIRACYDSISLECPSNISAIFKNLAERKPKVFIKSKDGYCLEKNTFDSINKKYSERENKIVVEQVLKNLPNLIPDINEKDFFNEALICFRNSAFRASIVMTWNLSFSHFCNWIFNHHLGSFNTQLTKSFPKAELSSVIKFDDFSILKESQIIQVAKSANIISNDVSKILTDKLNKRNSAAHPSSITILQYQAEDFITDLINNVVIKL
jgi:hypothetical protein